MYYKKCKECGANLDPEEICDCTRIVLSAQEYETFKDISIRYKFILDRLVTINPKINADPHLSEYYDSFFKAMEIIKLKG